MRAKVVVAILDRELAVSTIVAARTRGRSRESSVYSEAGPSEPAAVAMDALVLWCLFLAIGVAAMVTYARLPARELYQVSNPAIGTGIRRGLSFAAFPAAPVAVAVVWLLAEHLTRRAVTVAAVAATVLASSVFWPGAVDETDPDSRPISVLAVIAVVAVIGLTVSVARSAGFRRPRLFLGEERIRLAMFGLVFLMEIPWLTALIGVSLDHVPVLNSIYLSDSFVDQPGVAGLHPAVHAGLHHGLCGALLVTSSLWLSRHLQRVGNPTHRRVLAGYLSLLIAYGGANALQDFWLEQIVKRDLVRWQFPYMLQPKASWAFLGILAGAALIYETLLRPEAILDRSVPTRKVGGGVMVSSRGGRREGG